MVCPLSEKSNVLDILVQNELRLAGMVFSGPQLCILKGWGRVLQVFFGNFFGLFALVNFVFDLVEEVDSLYWSEVVEVCRGEFIEDGFVFFYEERI